MLVPYGHAPADFLVDVQSKLATQLIASPGDHPFLIEVATFAGAALSGIPTS
jgi:hypothetical protein